MGSSKTVHVTASLHVGVVREPSYRWYLVLLEGSKSSNLKAGMSSFVSVEAGDHIT